MQKKSPENLQFPENSLLTDERFQSEWDFCYLESSDTNTINLALIYVYTRQCPWDVNDTPIVQQGDNSKVRRLVVVYFHCLVWSNFGPQMTPSHEYYYETQILGYHGLHQ